MSFFALDEWLCYRCWTDVLGQTPITHGSVNAVKPRLRAAVFVNLVAMRSAMSRHRNGLVSLTDENQTLLKRANYILHCALNSCLIRFVVDVDPIFCVPFTLLWISGLARAAIDNDQMLWKIRPKHHQYLGVNMCEPYSAGVWLTRLKV